MSFRDIEVGSGRPRRQQQQQKDPSQAVASGIFLVNTAVSSFSRLVNSLGTPKDTLEHRDKLHKMRLHIGHLVTDTSAKLKQASETDQHLEVSVSKKIADAKLAKDFQSVLREFQKAQKLAAERETTYSPFVPKEVLPSSYDAHELDISSSRTPEQRALLLESKRQEVGLVDEIIFNEASIEEIEVNEIFKDLAVLVHEQAAMIDDVSSNIERSHADIIQATSQLAKAAKTQKSGSSLTCLLLLIFGIVLLIVIVVIVAGTIN